MEEIIGEAGKREARMKCLVASRKEEAKKKLVCYSLRGDTEHSTILCRHSRGRTAFQP